MKRWHELPGKGEAGIEGQGLGKRVVEEASSEHSGIAPPIHPAAAASIASTGPRGAAPAESTTREGRMTGCGGRSYPELQKPRPTSVAEPDDEVALSAITMLLGRASGTLERGCHATGGEDGNNGVGTKEVEERDPGERGWRKRTA